MPSLVVGLPQALRATLFRGGICSSTAEYNSKRQGSHAFCDRWACQGLSVGKCLHQRRRRVKELLRRPVSMPRTGAERIEGKRAELASIFEKGIWEVEADPQKVDHGRVMKARFALKWTVDAKGKPRAKASLVLQGFSDPDLLRGGLDTSSPTLNRTSRQVLALSVTQSWARWLADVATAFLHGDPQKRMLWRAFPEMHVT